MVTLQRYALSKQEGDLTGEDLQKLWQMLCTEKLVETFFHDNTVHSGHDFLAYAMDPGNWFYAAKDDAGFIGFIVFNNFTSSNNTACVHLCSFANGRKTDANGNKLFAKACQACMDLVAECSLLEHIICIIPKAYRGVRHWAERFGFEYIASLPNAMRLLRKSSSGKRAIITDAVIYRKTL